uniref:Gamma-glutamylcyclotransferase n=1 Tax=Macrostomum lignano TaxID=282301 RepID=A0A1I8F5G7_9PLAT
MKGADQGKLADALAGHADLRLTQAGSWRVWSQSVCFRWVQRGCWPFIELSFYSLQAGHVQVSQAGETSGVRLYPLELTLPPHKRPFMGRWVDSPRDALGFLALAAEASASCRSLAYSHQLEAPLREARAPVYPFAVRAADSAPSCRGVLETLKFPDSEPMYTVAVSEPLDALNADYSTLRLRHACAAVQQDGDSLITVLKFIQAMGRENLVVKPFLAALDKSRNLGAFLDAPS